MQLSRYLADRDFFQVNLSARIVDVNANKIPFLIIV
jgi:hypothetical protein